MDVSSAQFSPSVMSDSLQSHGWRSLVSYSPWSHKELETTEQLHFLSFHHPSSVAQLCPALCHPWTAACQVSLSITNSQSLLKLMSTESVMPSNHLIHCCPLLLLSSFPSIRIFSSESALHIKWLNFWSFSFSVSPSNEYSGLISFRID